MVLLSVRTVTASVHGSPSGGSALGGGFRHGLTGVLVGCILTQVRRQRANGGEPEQIRNRDDSVQFFTKGRLDTHGEQRVRNNPKL